MSAGRDLVPVVAGTRGGAGMSGEYRRMPLMGSWPWGSGSLTATSGSPGSARSALAPRDSVGSLSPGLQPVLGAGSGVSPMVAATDSAAARGDTELVPLVAAGGGGPAPRGVMDSRAEIRTHRLSRLIWGF